MHFIDVKTARLEEFFGENLPKYAILSHTWGSDTEELTFQEVKEGKTSKPGVGSVKLRECRHQATQDDLAYIWIDTCCIDKTNPEELSEAIRSMFRWYERAELCYVFLADVPTLPDDNDSGQFESDFRSSRWFTRGWTLQELLAPKELYFFNADWQFVGTKHELSDLVERATCIPRQFLQGLAPPHVASIAQRMSWAARRDTKRKEDRAYCLLGLFNVNMPTLYGEGGEHAFWRLQERIMQTTRDDSILAWGIDLAGSAARTSTHVVPAKVLAASPADFANSGAIVCRDRFVAPTNGFEYSGGSLRTRLLLYTTSNRATIGMLSCGPEDRAEVVVGIPLARTAQCGTDEYVRPQGACTQLCLAPSSSGFSATTLVHIRNVDEGQRTRASPGQQYVLYDRQFAELGLDIVEVDPPSFWDRKRAIITSAVKLDGGDAPQTLIRLCHKTKVAHDFVVALDFEETRGTDVRAAQHSVMICSRDTRLSELAMTKKYLTEKLRGVTSGSDGTVHLLVKLLPVSQQSVFMIRPEILPHPPSTTVDVSIELSRLQMVLQLIENLDKESQKLKAEEDVSQQTEHHNKRRQVIMARRSEVESQISRLNDELAQLKAEESQIEQRMAEVTERWRWLSVGGGRNGGREQTQKLWDAFIGAERVHGSRTPSHHDLMDWAVDNGYSEVARLIEEKFGPTWIPTPSVESGPLGTHTAAKETERWQVESWETKNWDAENWDAENLEAENLEVENLEGGAVHGLYEVIDLKEKNAAGLTPLLSAAKDGDEALVRLLLAKGADIDERDEEYGRTPLWYAAYWGHPDVVQVLLDYGADSEIPDYNYGRTPLLWAINRRHSAIQQLLQDGGANKEAKDPQMKATEAAGEARRWRQANASLDETIDGLKSRIESIRENAAYVSSGGLGTTRKGAEISRRLKGTAAE